MINWIFLNACILGQTIRDPQLRWKILFELQFFLNNEAYFDGLNEQNYSQSFGNFYSHYFAYLHYLSYFDFNLDFDLDLDFVIVIVIVSLSVFVFEFSLGLDLN